MGVQKYVIIVGFGCSGQSLVCLLEEEGIVYYVLEMDLELVQDVCNGGVNVFYGDVVWCESLVVVGIYCVVVLVVIYVSMFLVLKVLYYVYELELELLVIVCSYDDVDLEKLLVVGVIEVVLEVLEGSFMLVLYVLVMLGVLLCCVVYCVQDVCDECYVLLCGYFYGMFDVEVDGVGMNVCL